jgi:hypothetical protein
MDLLAVKGYHWDLLAAGGCVRSIMVPVIRCYKKDLLTAKWYQKNLSSLVVPDVSTLTMVASEGSSRSKVVQESDQDCVQVVKKESVSKVEGNLEIC